MRVPHTIRRVWMACLLLLALLAQARIGRAAPQQAAPPMPLPGSASQPSQTPAQPAPLALPDRDFPEAYVDLPFHASVSASGGSGAYSIALYSALPPGLTFQTGPSTLAIGGIPTAPGLYRFQIFVTDVGGATVSHDYTLNVHPETTHPPGAIDLTDTESFTFTDIDNQFFPLVITDNESFTFNDSEDEFMPDVLSDPEVFTFSDAVTLTLRVGIIPTTATAGTYNTSYYQIFYAVGNSGPVTLTPSGTLPTGLTFSAPGSSIVLSGTPTQTGTFPFTLTAQDTASATIVTYSLVISKATQTINVGAVPTPTYGGSPFSLSATSTSGLAVTITPTGGPVTGSGNGPYTIKAAGSATFQATQAGNADYAAAAPVNFSVTISPATLLVTPTSVSRPFDTPNPAFTYTVGPFVNGDTSAVISGTPTLATTAIGTSPAGTYPITANVSTMSAANYTFSPVAGTLTITGGDAQTIIFPQPPTLALGQSYHLAAFTTSGLPVTYTVSGAGSLNGNYVVAGGSPGTITVTASQPGNASYAAAPSVVRSFNIQ